MWILYCIVILWVTCAIKSDWYGIKDNIETIYDEFKLSIEVLWFCHRYPTTQWQQIYRHTKCLIHIILYPYYVTNNFISNFIYYFSFICGDSWTDYYPWFTLIERKARRDAACYRKYGHLENRNEVADQLDELAVVCNRLQSNNSCEDEYDRHTTKWGVITWKVNEERGLLTRTNASTPEEIKQEREEFLILVEKEAQLRVADVERLGELFKNILDWWD